MTQYTAMCVWTPVHYRHMNVLHISLQNLSSFAVMITSTLLEKLSTKVQNIPGTRNMVHILCIHTIS